MLRAESFTTQETDKEVVAYLHERSAWKLRVVASSKKRSESSNDLR